MPGRADARDRSLHEASPNGLPPDYKLSGPLEHASGRFMLRTT
jgi:hypothetical protein